MKKYGIIRRIGILVLAALMAVSSVGCGGKSSVKKGVRGTTGTSDSGEGRPLMECYNLEAQRFAENFVEDDIVTMFYQKNHETAEEYEVTEDKELIGKVFEALLEVRVLDQTTELASDYDDSFVFTLADANAFRFSFNQHNLVIGQEAYKITGDSALWKLADQIASGQKSSAKQTENTVKITPTEAQSVTLETYQSDAFTMKIPKGWTVTTGSYGMYHSISVTDPKNPVNQIFFLMKAQPLLHSQSGKEYYQSSNQMYGGAYQVFAEAPVMGNPSTEGFFHVFSEYADLAERVEASYSGYTFPRFENFEVVDRFNSNSAFRNVALNPALLHAAFTDASGRSGEGIFSADVIDMTGSQMNNFGIDAGYYMVYDVIAVTAESGSFSEWKDILCTCLSSLDYSSSYVQSAIQQSNDSTASSMQIRETLSSTSDMIMSSWEQRNLSEDIMRQKQRDATMGYERVYDTQTGKVYKANDGWCDSHLDSTNEKRYQKVTEDNLYTEPTKGFLEW
nr:hypothetical protein [uncultured Mediterraneibacter sp.]